MGTTFLSLAFLCALAPQVETKEQAETLLYVSTTPAGAEVLVDGKRVGVSDNIFHVEPGVRRIIVELEGHDPQGKEVTIRGGEITRVRLKLTKRPGPIAGGKPAAPVAGDGSGKPGVRAAGAPGQRPRHFVRLVVGKDIMTFEGQKTEWGTISPFLEKVPDRPHTVLEIAKAKGELSMDQWAKRWSDDFCRASTLARYFKFEYVDDVGTQPPGSKGSPAQTALEAEARPGDQRTWVHLYRPGGPLPIGAGWVHDLATGETLGPLSDPMVMDFPDCNRLGKGDLACYSPDTLSCLRGAKAVVSEIISHKRVVRPLSLAPQRATGRLITYQMNLVTYQMPELPCFLLVTTAENKHFEVTLLSVSQDGGLNFEYKPADPAVVRDSAGIKRVLLAQAAGRDEHSVLDLASGTTLACSKEADLDPGVFTRLGKGDLLFHDEVMACLRGAKAMQWDGKRFVPLPVQEQEKDGTAYKLPELPCRLLITTAEKKHFDVTILLVHFDVTILPVTPGTKDRQFLLEYRPAESPPTAKAERDWGTAAEGVQMRVRAEKSAWPRGSVPKLLVDLRNEGKRSLSIALEHESWELEIDGTWHKTHAGFSGCRRYLPLASGAQQKDLEVWLGGDLAEKLQALELGRHTMRVARLIPEFRAGEDVFRVVSNPIHIEIVRTESSPPAKVEADWGTAVEGVQMRVRADKPTWPRGSMPKLFADLRNQGKRNLRIALESESWELEIDGQWHRPNTGFTGRRRYLPLTPGGQQQDLEVWIPDVDNLGERLRALASGKHTLRVARYIPEIRPGEDVVRVVSSPIHIEIVRTESSPPAKVEAGWGTAVEGVQMRVRADKPAWAQGTMPKVFADLRNQGKRDLRIALEFESWELEIDGTWHKTDGSFSGSRRYLPLGPGGQQQDLRVSVFADDNLGQRLRALEPGKHTLRVARYVPQKIGPGVLRVVSNPIEIQIVAAAANSDPAFRELLRGKQALDLDTGQIASWIAKPPARCELAWEPGLGRHILCMAHETVPPLLNVRTFQEAIAAAEERLDELKKGGQSRATVIIATYYLVPTDRGNLAIVELGEVKTNGETYGWIIRWSLFEIGTDPAGSPKLTPVRRLSPGDAVPTGQPGAQPVKRVLLPEAKGRGEQSVLDLASGQTLACSEAAARDFGVFTRMGKGDLLYEDVLYCLRGAKAECLESDPFLAMKVEGDVTSYKPPKLPCRLRITTAEKRQFDVTIQAVTKEGQVLLEYRPADPAVVPKGALHVPPAAARLDEALRVIEQTPVTAVAGAHLTAAAIRELAGGLDQYSDYVGAPEIAGSSREFGQDLVGVGIELTFDQKARELVVAAPLPGTPAQRAGLQAGDRIVEIDGRPTSGLPQGRELAAAVILLRGRPGDAVTLAVKHTGSGALREIKAERGIIHFPAVKGDLRRSDGKWDFMLDQKQKIGYVRLASFGPRSAEDLQGALAELKSQGMKGFILDLRNNPGGFLSQAVQVADLFVESGVIVSVDGRDRPGQAWSAKTKGTLTGFPMAALVNGGSAGASEIVAASLQDHKRAIVVGERTCGKAVAQRVFPLDTKDQALRLTAAAFLRPSGKSLHRAAGAKPSDDWGVVPDPGYQVKLSPEEVKQYVEYRRQRDVFRKEGPPKSDFKDRPLQKALDWLLAAEQQQTA